MTEPTAKGLYNDLLEKLWNHTTISPKVYQDIKDTITIIMSLCKKEERKIVYEEFRQMIHRQWQDLMKEKELSEARKDEL